MPVLCLLLCHLFMFFGKSVQQCFSANCFIALNVVYFFLNNMCFNQRDEQEVRGSIPEQISTNVRYFPSLPRKGSRPRWMPSRLLPDVPLHVGIGSCTNFCSLSLSVINLVDVFIGIVHQKGTHETSLRTISMSSSACSTACRGVCGMSTH